MRRIRPKTKFKQGAASFYIVAFSTLILVVIAMSFTAIVISNITRTSNDDLAQSAYDSALAGIEDAKLAYYNYQSCLESKADFSDAKVKVDGNVTCEDIVAWVESPDDEKENMKRCDMVGHILGRIPESGSGEVFIQETTGNNGNTMQQAYTCVIIDTKVNNYKATLSGDSSTRVVQAKLDGATANEIKTIRVSWYSKTDGADYQFTNSNGSKIIFPTLATKAATPPTISVGLVQTAGVFSLDDFDKTESGATDRGTIFLAPTDNKTTASTDNLPDNHIGAYGRGGHDNINFITVSDVVKSNDRTVKNLPYAVLCNPSTDAEFACSATIELPDVIQYDSNSTRSNETFMVVINIPYGQPSTDVQLEFCKDSNECSSQVNEDGETITNIVDLKNVQVSIDSTGRANDLYRRVSARLDTADTYFPYPLYALELLGSDSDPNLVKNMTVLCEYQDWGSFKKTCGN